MKSLGNKEGRRKKHKNTTLTRKDFEKNNLNYLKYMQKLSQISRNSEGNYAPLVTKGSVFNCTQEEFKIAEVIRYNHKIVLKMCFSSPIMHSYAQYSITVLKF